MKRERQIIESLLAGTGITIDGSNPYDPQVHNEGFYGRVLRRGSLGLGESYMDGWWDCENLDQFFHKIISAGIEKKISPWSLVLVYLQSLLTNQQTRIRSKKVAQEHYDLSPELYESFLDPYNQYTCGYFKDTNNLNEAQEKKLDLICRKLQLSDRDKVLDIGCGWGGFAKYAAKHYGCHVTGITISDEQAQYAREYTQGLPVEIKLIDYRDLSEKYDKILVCGMIEHVGYKNYRTFMKVVHNALKDDGLFLLHTMGGNHSVRGTDPWINKYIFPNGMLPSIKQIGKSIEGLLVMEDWHNFGTNYDKTLMAWFENFHKGWPNLKDKYGNRFYRMWKYYLLSCAGSFRARRIQLWQIVLSKHGVPDGYISVR